MIAIKQITLMMKETYSSIRRAALLLLADLTSVLPIQHRRTLLVESLTDVEVSGISDEEDKLDIILDESVQIYLHQGASSLFGYWMQKESRN